MKYKLIRQFVENFKKEMMRSPTKQEISDNLVSDTVQVTEQIIDQYLAKEGETLLNEVEAQV